jgi:hypothetical protein
LTGDEKGSPSTTVVGGAVIS